jgi:hypothetical protein
VWTCAGDELSHLRKRAGGNGPTGLMMAMQVAGGPAVAGRSAACILPALTVARGQ